MLIEFVAGALKNVLEARDNTHEVLAALIKVSLQNFPNHEQWCQDLVGIISVPQVHFECASKRLNKHGGRQSAQA